MKILGAIFDKIWVWAVYSSANPGKISSTVKWGLAGLGTILTIVFGFEHAIFPTDQLTGIGDQLIQLVQSVALVITLAGSIVSALRKIWMTIQGQHATLVSIPTSTV